MTSNTEHQLLQYIADSLTAEDSNKYKQYLQYFEDIKSTLLRCSQFQISRVTLTGSMKKRTAVHHKFDCDIIVYIRMDGSFNDKITIKQHFLNRAEGILRKGLTSMKIGRPTPNSFQFSIGDFDFDILPAVDLLEDWSDPNASRQQCRKVIQLCNLESEPNMASYKLKASLSEYCDDFIKNQSDFIRRLIVLCKHWCRVYLSTSVNFPGRSSTMELIAMSVGLQMERMGRFDLFEALKDFLRQCSNIENCAIEFSQTAYLSNFNTASIRRQRPYLLDPMNLYNNRLYGIKPHSRRDIRSFANQSMRHFDEPERNFLQPFDNSNRNNPDFESFFRLHSYLTKEGTSYENYRQFLQKRQEIIHRSSVQSNFETRSDEVRLISDIETLSVNNVTKRANISAHPQRRSNLNTLNERNAVKPQSIKVDTNSQVAIFKDHPFMIAELKKTMRKLQVYYCEAEKCLSTEVTGDIESLIEHIRIFADELNSQMSYRSLSPNLTSQMMNVNEYSKKLQIMTELLKEAEDSCSDAVKLLEYNTIWPLKGNALLLHRQMFDLFLLLDSIRLKFAPRMRDISNEIKRNIVPVLKSICTNPSMKYFHIFHDMADILKVFNQLIYTFQEGVPKAETDLKYRVVFVSQEGITLILFNGVKNLLSKCHAPLDIMNSLIMMLSNSFKNLSDRLLMEP